MQIRIHHRDRRAGPWRTTNAEVDQIPQTGEFIAPAPVNVYRVVLTLHVLFPADYSAEVFAELIDFDEVQQESLGRPVWRG
jgi:hypothetical protein